MAMALGIFAGTGMEVRAAGSVQFQKLTEADFTRSKLSSLVSGSKYDFGNMSDEFWDELDVWFADKPSGTLVVASYQPPFDNKDEDDEFLQIIFKWGGYIMPLDSLYDLSLIKQDWKIDFKEVDCSNLYALQYIQVTPGTSEGTSNSEVSSAPHTHSYSWVTVQDVSSEQDGIEEYRCSCGDVQERCVIPRYMAIVKGLFGEIKNAPQNGTATFDSGRLYTISDYVIKKLAERTDVTTVITFEYQNQAYKMTIPAGADFTGLLADEEYFYGYFFFANAVGATIEAL